MANTEFGTRIGYLIKFFDSGAGVYLGERPREVVNLIHGHIAHLADVGELVGEFKVEREDRADFIPNEREHLKQTEVGGHVL